MSHDVAHGIAQAAQGSSERLVGLPPVIARHTRLVLLGSFPGVASLRAGQYYAHPRNQFWPLVGSLLGEPLATLPYRERLARLRARGVGLWDVYAACRRAGSLDSAIEAAELNDLGSLKRRAPGLVAVAHNGGESARHRRHLEALGLPVWRLPSSSPANASWHFERKLAAWREVFAFAGLLRTTAGKCAGQDAPPCTMPPPSPPVGTG